MNVTIGNRVPRDYFITRGSGESDITVHAGSFHLALREAGVEMCNIMTYSSILPGSAREVERPDPASLRHGSVMESIMAVASCERGERATAGIIYGWLYDGERRHGGLVAEYNGGLDRRHAARHLNMMLLELHGNGYERYALGDVTVLTQTVKPEKAHGTALVALCFLNYDVEVGP